MPYRNGVTYYGAYGGGDNTASQARNSTTLRQLSESTKQLFKAIDDENLENFKQALAEGADVNAFDERYTPLMTIIMNGDDSPICLKMMMLLLQHQNLNINAQETKKCNTALHLAFHMENKNFIRMLLRHPSINTNSKNKVFLLQDKYLEPEHDRTRAYLIEHAEYNQCFFYTSKEYIEKIGRIQKKDFSHLTMEITKAQKGKKLLDALFNGNINRAKTLLAQELNPNCWKRNQNGEIETPLSLICLQGITQDNEEVLIKLLKHTDLDFSQIKPIRAIEQNSRLKKIIEQAITERLTDAINRKDLDDVEKLVEDNCFINRAIVTAAFESIERIRNYLNEKFPTSAEQPVANTNNIPAGFEEFAQKLVDELEKTKAQLAETEQKLDKVVREKTSETSKISQLERDLKQVREERDRLSSENILLRTKSLSNKNEKSSEAISPGKKQSNYAYAFFILSGALTGCVDLAILYDYLVIGACLTAVALVLFLVGYYLCKADERDIGPGGTTDNPQVTRVLISSPGPAENFCTC
ncbi:ankyrin repeat domain-containing protein [Wolbachia endosymbiont (group A) of Andrena dorsata]|uniref:ankyrin repeat domain-containing protein n=1 Tax=Wolbachia endosymbiont (group A) of Andrena dorsata TaxID=2953975 RepID=UPI00222E7B47|nr:ankyrin repeat domain-containing protein [Wolbachia endosymbiont (group A) of Andrena dorsata]